MDWENERYVRLYTRETLTTKQLKWQGRAVLAELLKKVDRCGILELDGYDLETETGIDALASLLDMPVEVTQEGLRRLLLTKTVQRLPGGLFLPKFLRAQEAKQSDPQRQRESRAKRHAEARAAALGLLPGEEGSSRNVTAGHETIIGGESRNVTSPPGPRIETRPNVTPSRPMLPQNRAEVVEATRPDARDSLIRFRDMSKDALDVPRVSLGSKPDSEPSAALIELWRKAILRHSPVTHDELDRMARAIGSGDLWGTERVLPASRLAQIPDQRHPDNFGNLLIWVRSPDRPTAPMWDAEHPARYFGSKRHRAAQKNAATRSQKRAKAVKPAEPAPAASTPPDPRQHSWDLFLAPPKVP